MLRCQDGGASAWVGVTIFRSASLLASISVRFDHVTRRPPAPAPAPAPAPVHLDTKLCHTFPQIYTYMCLLISHDAELIKLYIQCLFPEEQLPS
jgi:hypothetical protein